MNRSKRGRKQARARRPLFVPVRSGPRLVKEIGVSFAWFGGFSVEQKRRSITAFHAAATEHRLVNVLEISSSSPNPLGIALSAFNLRVAAPGGARTTVEAAYQGSKVYREAGGPWPEVYSMGSREARAFRMRFEEDSLEAFELAGERWPLQPLTAFYDWVYLQALLQAPRLSRQLSAFEAFSDIAFNPARSQACQARSAALFVALEARGDLAGALESKEAFLAVLKAGESTAEEGPNSGQRRLF